MPEMISNSSCIIVLDNIDMLWVLKELYGEVLITEEVLAEFGKQAEKWMKTRKVKNKIYVDILHNFVDLGEASTIALALEMKKSSMILDDHRARKLAKNLELKFTGTLGVIMKAKKKAIIPSVSEVVGQLKLNKFRMSDQLISRILELSGE
jgi:predicted nucleic acid-binding protein